MKLSYKQKERMIDVLTDYAKSKFIEMTREKHALVQVYAGVITQSISDFHSGNLKNKRSATNYFQSTLFLVHCEALSIDEELVMRLLKEQEKYQKHIGEFEPSETEDD